MLELKKKKTTPKYCYKNEDPDELFLDWTNQNMRERGYINSILENQNRNHCCVVQATE